MDKLDKLALVFLTAVLLPACTGSPSSDSTIDEMSEEPAFGHARSCAIPDPGANLVEFSVGADHITTLGSDGLFTTAPPSASRDFGSVVTTRRLTPRGIDAVVGTVESLGLTPGCRHVYSPGDSGTLSAITDAGITHLYWGPYLGAYPGFELMRVLNAGELAALADLKSQLEDLEAWLPSDGFAGPQNEFVPERWMVTAGTYPGGHSPDDWLGFLGGKELVGSNPDIAEVTMWDGQTLVDFNCAIVERAEAIRLTDMLERNASFSRNLSHFMSEEVTVVVADVVAMLPGDSGAECVGPPQPTVPVAAGTRVMSQSDTDPCSVLPPEAVSDLLDADKMVTRPARQAFGELECYYSTTHLYDWPVEIATLSLLSQNQTPREADALVRALFGAGTVERPVLGRPVWSNACWSMTLVCPPAVAMWADPFVVLMTFPPSAFARQVSEETAIELAAAALSRTEG